MEQELAMDVATSGRPGAGRALSAPLRIFYAPGSVLEDVRDGLPWWPGLIIMILLALAIGMVMVPQQLELMRAEAASGEMAGIELGADGELPAPVRIGIIATSVGGALLGVPLMLMLVTLFYWLALLVTFGGAPYWRLFTLGIYTGFVALAGQILSILYVRFSGVEITRLADLREAALDLSLGAFTEGGGLLDNFLGALGVFPIWEIVLYIMGAALLMRKSRGAVAGPVLVIFLLGALVAAFLGTLGGSFGG